jgi:hypothetical protein
MLQTVNSKQNLRKKYEKILLAFLLLVAPHHATATDQSSNGSTVEILRLQRQIAELIQKQTAQETLISKLTTTIGDISEGKRRLNVVRAGTMQMDHGSIVSDENGMVIRHNRGYVIQMYGDGTRVGLPTGHVFSFQADGNLVWVNGPTLIWHTATHGR